MEAAIEKNREWSRRCRVYQSAKLSKYPFEMSFSLFAVKQANDPTFFIVQTEYEGSTVRKLNTEIRNICEIDGIPI